MTVALLIFIGWVVSIALSLLFCHIGTLKCVVKYGEEAKLTKQSASFIIKLIFICAVPLVNIFWSYEFASNAVKYIKLEDGEN